jgi:bifunctional DNA-binding transcriptional regulator/antitoxin component of YhaV-PrlF toxin-antitoxin module
MSGYSLRDDGVIVGKLGRGRKITIPQEVCETLGLREGEFIGLKITHEGVSLLPQSAIEKVVRKGLDARSKS